MPIKNYTTTVGVGRTVGKIQRLLLKAGAKAILSEFGDDGVMESLSFKIDTPQGKVGYRLPANIDGVWLALKKQKVPPRYTLREHAAKVAWRIVEDWIAAQLAIIESEMVTAAQIFLPYMLTKDDRTVYEVFEEKGQALLTQGDTNGRRQDRSERRTGDSAARGTRRTGAREGATRAC